MRLSYAEGHELEYEIIPFDLATASAEEWAINYRFTCKTAKELFPDYPIEDLESYRADMINTLMFYDVNAYIVIRKDEPTEAIGWLRCTFMKDDSPSYPGNEDICQIHLIILDKYRQIGIARKLLAIAYEQALEHNRTQFTGTLLNAAAREFLRDIGGKEALAFQNSCFNMKDVDWNLMEQWVNEGPRRAPTSNLEFHLSIPDSILEDYCNVYTEVLNQAPRDELTIGDDVFTPEKWKKLESQARKTGITWITAIVKEQDGDIAGLTEVIYESSTPTIMHQELTGVQEKYRGRGLGKWLKGVMLLKIRNEYSAVELVSTSNATSNEPMLAINEKMGFRVKHETYMFQVDLQKVKGFLSRD